MSVNVHSSQWPAGTQEELRILGRDLRSFGSCSKPSAENVGCQFYDPARGPRCQLKDRQGVLFKDRGPVHLAVRLTNADGASDDKETTCFFFYKTYWPRHEARARTGDRVEIVALEGEQYWFRGKRTKHMTRQQGMNEKPPCPDC